MQQYIFMALLAYMKYYSTIWTIKLAPLNLQEYTALVLKNKNYIVIMKY
jgi:hypothetical protein